MNGASYLGAATHCAVQKITVQCGCPLQVQISELHFLVLKYIMSINIIDIMSINIIDIMSINIIDIMSINIIDIMSINIIDIMSINISAEGDVGRGFYVYKYICRGRRRAGISPSPTLPTSCYACAPWI